MRAAKPNNSPTAVVYTSASSKMLYARRPRRAAPGRQTTSECPLRPLPACAPPRPGGWRRRPRPDPLHPRDPHAGRRARRRRPQGAPTPAWPAACCTPHTATPRSTTSPRRPGPAGRSTARRRSTHAAVPASPARSVGSGTDPGPSGCSIPGGEPVPPPGRAARPTKTG